MAASGLIVEPSSGKTYDLGVITLRLLVGAKQTMGEFAFGEFSGGDGPWTVPHVHEHTQESFYVLDGRFTFTLGNDEVEVGPGAFILVPPGTRHMIHAHGGGSFLTLWVPGGAEAMFEELSEMSPDSLRDPKARNRIASRFDSIPV